jgi:hypothetical protein
MASGSEAARAVLACVVERKRDQPEDDTELPPRDLAQRGAADHGDRPNREDRHREQDELPCPIGERPRAGTECAVRVGGRNCATSARTNDV